MHSHSGSWSDMARRQFRKTNDHIALDPAAFTATHPAYRAVGEYTGCSKLVSDNGMDYCMT